VNLWRSKVRLIALAIMAVVAVTLSGCNQLSAKNRLAKLNKILVQIQTHEGPDRPYRFQNEQVVSLENDINQVRDLIAREAYQEAADLARRRIETAPGLRDVVIQDHGTAIFQEADDDIKVAEQNDGRIEDPDLWSRILEMREDVRASRSEQAWDDVIEQSQEIKDAVGTLLLNLRNRASQAHNEALNRMTAFEALGAEQHVPAQVVESRQMVQNVEDLIEGRSYRLAIATAEEALTKINETIVATKRSLSNQGMSRIESLITEALEHGVDFRWPDRYRTFSDKFDQLFKFFYDTEYDQALLQITLMTPEAQRLLLDTYEHESNALIELRGEEIRQLEEAEVEKYLTGRIGEAISLHERAQGHHQQATERAAEVETWPAPSPPETLEGVLLEEVKPIYIDSVESSEAADGEIANIHRAFRELTERQLADAQGAISVAEEVLDRFDTIWDPRVDRATNPADVQFEENKRLLKAEITERLENARGLNTVGDFMLNYTPPRYNVAIESAEEARVQAEEVLADTYRVVARNSLIELTWMADRYEREGAGEYATGELDRTLRLIQEARQTLAEGAPRDAVSQCSEARAQLEIMIQALRRVANENIQTLRDMEVETGGMLEEINAAERLELITQLRTRAETQARADDLKDAIETARRGQRLAGQTTAEAAREWARNELDDARARIAHAEDAGAALYAPTALQDARDLIDAARRRFAAEEFLTAQRTAAEASERADAARLTLITQAEEAAVRARNYDGWRFHHESLADALVAIQRAGLAMNRGDFGESRDLALFARRRSDEITGLSRQQLFAERMESLRQSVEHAMTTGSTHFQPVELEAVLDEMAVIDRDYDPGRHDDYARDLEALEARMAILIEGTPEILAETLDGHRDWIRALREQGADLYAYEELEQVARLIVRARESFESGLERQAHRAVVEAGSVLGEVQLMADEFAFKAEVDGILAQLEAARREFGEYISVNPAMMKRLAISPGGASRFTAIVGLATPSEFRQEIERLQAVANTITPPSTQGGHHSKLLACLRNAQSAARNFEYLKIADTLSEREVNERIDDAYAFLEASHRQELELGEGLIERPLDGPVTMTELGRPLLNRAEAAFSHGEHR
jgi:hypothetical protein